MKNTNSVLIGERIKKQRLLNGYSREKLAEMADITPRFCYDLELGLKNMSVNTLLKISEALNVPVGYRFVLPALFAGRSDSGQLFCSGAVFPDRSAQACTYHQHLPDAGG